MDVTTMVSISSLLPELRQTYPSYHFVAGDIATWSSEEATVYYVEGDEPEASYQLLHELGHALLSHSRYNQDIDLLKMERDAWHKASEVARRLFDLVIPEEDIQSHLDSYRDWLHARSRCPQCDQAGLQQARDGVYRCILCQTTWRANEAKQCGLKRYQTKTSA
jgi:ribosomal protein L37AE/L43A